MYRNPGGTRLTLSVSVSPRCTHTYTHTHTHTRTHYSEANGLVPSQLLRKNNFITNEYSLPLLPASAFEVPLKSTHQLYSLDISGRLGGGEITLSAFSRAETEAPQKACALLKAAWLMGEADRGIPCCQLPMCLPGRPGTRRTPHTAVSTEL